MIDNKEVPTHEELLDRARELETFAKGVIEHLEDFIKNRKEANDVETSTPLS